MNNDGFNPDDIADIMSRYGRGHKKSARPATAGIPDFVPCKSARHSHATPQQNDAIWAAAADRAEQQQAQELSPPVNPCFSRADIDEILARKPQKYRMTERDYKELGRNMVLGVGDLIVGTAQAVAIINEVIPENNEPTSTSGWGYDIDGNFDFYGPYEPWVSYKR